MPRGRQRITQESAEDRALRELDEEDTGTIESLAREAGPPPDSEKLSDRDEDEAWEATDPQVDHEQMATMLMTQGLPPELAQQLLIVKLRPDDDWMSVLTRPTQDAELANQIARVAKYPFRLSLFDGIEDPDEQVRKSNHLDKRYQRKMAALMAPQPMPEPTQPMQTPGQPTAPEEGAPY